MVKEEGTTSRHSISNLLEVAGIKVWQLEAIVPRFYPMQHANKYPMNRHTPMSPEHYHYTLDIYRTVYMEFYRKKIGW